MTQFLYCTKVTPTSQARFENENLLGFRNDLIALTHGHIKNNGVKIALLFGHTVDTDVFGDAKENIQALIEDLSSTGLLREYLQFSEIVEIDVEQFGGKWVQTEALSRLRKTSYSQARQKASLDGGQWVNKGPERQKKLTRFSVKSNSSGHVFTKQLNVRPVQAFIDFNPNSYGLGSKERIVTLPLL